MKFFLLICACFIGNCAMAERDNSYQETLAVINKYSKTLKNEKKIRNSSYGLHYAGPDKIYDGKIHTIDLGYRLDKNLKYNEARTYFYSIVDGLLNHINKNTQLAKYFFHYPVDYSDLEFHFSFEDDKKGELKRDEVQSIHIVRNEIFYEIVEQEGSPNKVEHTQVGPDVYYMTGLLTKNRSIIRPIAEDLKVAKE